MLTGVSFAEDIIMAQGDTFLKLDGIEGESQDDRHKGEIHIKSYNLAAANSGSAGANLGSGIGKAQVQDLGFTKHVDKSSPNLFISCCSGKPIQTAVLTVRKAGEKPQEYMTITLTEVFVSSFNHTGNDGAGLPLESVSLNFSKIKFEYKTQLSDGTLGAAIAKTYDIKANKIS
ncbi:MAG: Hcp family type VI secretion system effector [Roseiarcus sp.]